MPKSLEQPASQPIYGVGEETPRYDLTPEEEQVLEKELVNKVKTELNTDTIAAVWLGPFDRFANLLRAKESALFPEVADLPMEREASSLFLALVDTRGPEGRLVHAAAVSGPRVFEVSGVDSQNPQSLGEGSTGFMSVDDLIEEGNFDRDEFVEYYVDQGVDLENSIAVETNYRVGEKTALNGIGTANLAYIAFSKLLERMDNPNSHKVVFASINSDSIRSFEKYGLVWSPLMGRTDIKTSEGPDFTAVVLPYEGGSNQQLLQPLQGLLTDLTL